MIELINIVLYRSLIFSNFLILFRLAVAEWVRAVAEWVRALAWRPGRPGFESR